MTLRRPIVAAALAVLAGCGQPAGSSPDAGRPLQADAASEDAGATPTRDGSQATDDAAAAEADASEGLDATDPFDAASSADAAPEPVDASAEPADADVVGPADAAGLPDAAGTVFDASEAGLDAAPSVGPDASARPDAAASGPDAGCSVCSAYAGASIKGVMPTALAEVSGLAMSALHPGVLFAHNDSGDGARFFAVDLDGNVLGEFVLAGVTAVDWEDLAIGPCPAGSCVYLGDIGDNLQVRADYAVYRVPVPDVDVGDRLGTVGVTWERLPYQYPAGAKWNAETLLVHPQNGDVYLVNKLSLGKASTVFKFPQPLTPGVQATLSEVAVLPIPGPTDTQLTGGDTHPCGNAVLLRTYNRLYEFRLPAGAASFDAVFTSGDYGTVPVATEQQGEAVAYQPGGKGYVTASESVSSTPVFINVHSCQ